MESRKFGLRKFDLLQILIVGAIIAFLVVMLNSGDSQAAMSDIESAMSAEPSVTALTRKTIQDAGKNLSFDASLAEEGLYYRVDDVMNVNELLILHIKDDQNRELVSEAVDKYLEEKKNSFEGYGTDQFGLLSNAVLTEKGEYLFFGVSPDVLTWESDFVNCFK